MTKLDDVVTLLGSYQDSKVTELKETLLPQNEDSSHIYHVVYTVNNVLKKHKVRADNAKHARLLVMSRHNPDADTKFISIDTAY